MEWPVGSGNRLTTLLKWGYTCNKPNTITASASRGTGSAQFNILTEAQYIYLAYNGSIQLFDNSSYLRIRNLYMQVGIGSGNTDIFSKITKQASCSSGTLNISWSSLIGLLPFGDTFSNAVSFFSAIEYKVENSSAGTTTYPITVNGQLLQYGKVVRGHKATIGSNDYLYTEGQQLLLEYEVCVPLDKPRVSGNRVFHNGFYFEIYSRHPVWLTYSVLEATVNKTVTNNYYVQ